MKGLLARVVAGFASESKQAGKRIRKIYGVEEERHSKRSYFWPLLILFAVVHFVVLPGGLTFTNSGDIVGEFFGLVIAARVLSFFID